MHALDYNTKLKFFYDQRFDKNEVQEIDIAFVPESISEAYEIQKDIICQRGVSVLGWKLGGTNAKTQKVFDCKSCYIGPVYSISKGIKSNISSKPYYRAELELCFRISESILEMSLEKIVNDPLQFFDFVYPSAEFPVSNIKNIASLGLNALVADLCGTGHIAIGEGCHISDFYKIDTTNLRVSISSASNILAEGMLSNLIGGYKKVLSDFLLVIWGNKFDVLPGQYCAIGGLTECIVLPIGEELVVKFDGFSNFSIFLDN